MWDNLYMFTENRTIIVIICSLKEKLPINALFLLFNSCFHFNFFKKITGKHLCINLSSLYKELFISYTRKTYECIWLVINEKSYINLRLYLQFLKLFISNCHFIFISFLICCDLFRILKIIFIFILHSRLCYCINILYEF